MGYLYTAVISTFISVLKFIDQHSGSNQGINAVVSDFFHVIIDMMRFNTPFLNAFWHNSPQPDFSRDLFASPNMLFWLIYILVFVVLALQASGARISRQVKHVREGVEDQMVLEQARGNSGISAPSLNSALSWPVILYCCSFSRCTFCR